MLYKKTLDGLLAGWIAMFRYFKWKNFWAHNQAQMKKLLFILLRNKMTMRP